MRKLFDAIRLPDGSRAADRWPVLLRCVAQRMHGVDLSAPATEVYDDVVALVATEVCRLGDPLIYQPHPAPIIAEAVVSHALEEASHG